MTKDLGEVFRVASARSRAWTRDDVWRALKGLTSTGSKVDWEPGDEQWGRVLDGAGVVGLICARVPVGAVRNDVDPRLLSDPVTWIRFNSMNDHDFKVERELLEEIFGCALSENVNYSSLSLNDLWWATVS